MVSVASLETAFGTLWLAASERGLCRLALPSAKEHTRFREWMVRLPQWDSDAGKSPSIPLCQRGKRGAQGDFLRVSLVPIQKCRVTSPQREREPTDSLGQYVLARAKTELSEYLAGVRRDFTVPLDLDGSEFFRRAWAALLAIPYGHTLTYAALAAKLHSPRAFRAVGAACALNPVPLIIPCHRAVGSNGSLTGFAGGLAMKEALLRMEGALGKESRV